LSNSKLTQTMKTLDEEILACNLCRLCQSRTNAVPGSGITTTPKLVFIGEGPGRNEDLQGKPFVGRGGKLLDELLESVSLKREDVYITNIVKCRPPKNRKPKADEVEICTSHYLEKQLDLLQPKLVCTLGATALQYFTGEKEMGNTHGKLFKTKSGILLLPTYHPAAVFRNRKLKKSLEEDLQKISNLIERGNRK
jgi:uracil-DNA glycosylase